MAAPIENIAVVVKTTDSSGIVSPLINKRMQASVTTIADNVLVGRDSGEIAAQRDSYEQLIQEVFGRILLGFTVQSVIIEPESDVTSVEVTVIPWPDVIGKVEVTVDIDTESPRVRSLALADSAGIGAVFANVLTGLPVDAIEWTRSINKLNLNDFLQQHLPEYRAEFEITIVGDTASVAIMLYPQGAQVRGTDLTLVSKSIPNIALLSYRSAIQRQADELIGVPVAFVKRHSRELAAVMADRINSDRRIGRFGVTATADIRPATTTDITVTADTDEFNVTLEGYLDIGRDKDNTSFKLHAGRYISALDEVFVELDLSLHDVEWDVYPGLSRRITPYTTLGFKYNVGDNESIWWGKHNIRDKWLLRYEYTVQQHDSEFAVRYKLHDYLGLEYVITEDDDWLRLVGNF